MTTEWSPLTPPVILVCALPPESEWVPDPFPGSDEARIMGCSCPTEQHLWPEKQLRLSSDCIPHELEKSAKH